MVNSQFSTHDCQFYSTSGVNGHIQDCMDTYVEDPHKPAKTTEGQPGHRTHAGVGMKGVLLQRRRLSVIPATMLSRLQ